MRRRLVLVFAWACATAVAIAGSWVGLQPVLAAAAPEVHTPLPVSQLREAASSVTPGPTDPAGPSLSPTPSPTPSPAPEPTPSESPGPPFPEPPTSSEWEQIDGRNSWERTFVLRGGEVVVRANRRDVQVVSDAANPGYNLSVTRWTRTSLIVSFESVEHTSRLWVMWRDGPYAEMTETV